MTVEVCQHAYRETCSHAFVVVRGHEHSSFPPGWHFGEPQQRVRFSDLAFCPLTKPTGTLDLVMAWSPVRDDVVKTAFLDFIRSKEKLIRSSLKVESA